MRLKGLAPRKPDKTNHLRPESESKGGWGSTPRHQISPCGRAIYRVLQGYASRYFNSAIRMYIAFLACRK
jgi:hypothetical protein